MSFLAPEYHAHLDDPSHLKNKAKKSPAEAGHLSIAGI